MAAKSVIEILITAKNTASNVLKAVAGDAEGLSKTLVEVGGALTIVTAALTIGIGSSVQAATRFNEQMTNTASVLGIARDEQAALTREILDFARDTRAGPQQVALAYYDIVGGIADTTVHMATLQAATRTAEAGNAALAGTTSALVSIMNAYSLAAEEAAMVSDVLTRTVQVGVGTMDEFASALPQVAGIANSVGISFAELGAQAAFLTTKGFTASDAVTQLRSMITGLISPSAEMNKLLAASGFASGEAAIRSLGLAGAYKTLERNAAAAGVNFATAVGRVEALNGAIALSSSAAAEALGRFEDNLTGATDAARAIQMQDPAYQMDLFRSTIEALRIEIGTAFMPVINNILGTIRPVLSIIFEWMTANPQLTTTIVSLVAAIGAIGPAITAAGVALRIFNTIAMAATSPLGIVLLIIGLLGTAFITNFGGIRDMLADTVFPLLQALGELFSELFQVIAPILSAIFELFSSTVGVMLQMLKPFIDLLVLAIRMLTSIVKIITGDVTGAMNSLGQSMTQMGMPTGPGGMSAAAMSQQGFGSRGGIGGGSSQYVSRDYGGIADTSQYFTQNLGNNVSYDPETQYRLDVMRGQGNLPAANLSGAGGGSRSGATNVNVTVTERNVLTPEQARQNGNDFGGQVAAEWRRRGNS